MNRREANECLLHALEGLISSYPDLRFSELLSSFGFVTPDKSVLNVNTGRLDPTWKDESTLESHDLLLRVDEACAENLPIYGGNEETDG